MEDNTKLLDFCLQNDIYKYPSGTYLVKSDNFSMAEELLSILGYNEYEYYISIHKPVIYELDESKLDKILAGEKDNKVVIMWELFSNSALCIVSPFGEILTQDEITKCYYEVKFNYHGKTASREYKTLFNLECAISEGDCISKSFIQRTLNIHSSEDIIESDPYLFFFDNNGFLIDAKFHGYKVSTCLDFGESEISSYQKYANTYGFADDLEMKKMIDYQSFCREKIDYEIMQSAISKMKFSYSKDDCCVNWIAMAAYYKQFDVDFNMFLLSLNGEYEIKSKENRNGILVTKIKAYNEVFEFYDNHLFLSESIIIPKDEYLDKKESNLEGYIYVMINPSLEGLVKIGKTSRNPEERVKELSSATGVPTPFILVYYREFSDCGLAEKIIHNFLEEKGYRVNENREFFKLPTNTAITIVQTFYDELMSD